MSEISRCEKLTKDPIVLKFLKSIDSLTSVEFILTKAYMNGSQDMYDLMMRSKKEHEAADQAIAETEKAI